MGLFDLFRAKARVTKKVPTKSKTVPLQPRDRPTKKQLDYAKLCGVAVRPGMNRSAVSSAIDAAFKADPKLGFKAAARKKRDDTKHAGQYAERDKLLKKWNQFADGPEYMLAIYEKGKNVVVDVLRVNEADESGKTGVSLFCEAPKLRKDKHLGEHLEFERVVKLNVKKLLYHEPLPRFQDDHDTEIDRYQKAVKRGLGIAKKL
ncbi:hypothetical protein [Planctomycetes bacterium K23_9]|uniref:Uncharacterized protein n=1 Tax=Stieleria marina TaxID=1930275 RepID=A0A517NUC8_9BACT|nr:hypothetical protein K239x_26740 [Planctomycetes bacterium K23_9]